MSVTLRQTRSPDQHIVLRGLSPKRLAVLTGAEIGRMNLFLGNRRYPLREFFTVELSGQDAGTLTVVPTDDRIDWIGAALDSGQVIVEGGAGDLVGAGMTGGSIQATGKAGDLCGSAMRGGQLSIDRESGDHPGGPLGGEQLGQRGGIILVRGSTGAFAGECLRRGLLRVEGDTGEYLGHRMVAGTVYCGGTTGELAGYGMRRGTLMLRESPPSLPHAFADKGIKEPVFLPLLWRQLSSFLHRSVQQPAAVQRVERYLGDLACDGRGEILVFR